MANQEHLDILKQGIDNWNDWRRRFPRERPDLSRADLSGANLSRANLSDANLNRADLRNTNLSRTSLWEANLYRACFVHANLSYADCSEAYLYQAILSYANFNRADLKGANLSETTNYDTYFLGANLSRADLSRATFIGGARRVDFRGANLSRANLSRATFKNADLSGVDLSEAILIQTDLTEANLTNSRIYGISVWDVQLFRVEQTGLILTSSNEPTITVDNLKVAQFIHLLLNNQEIRDAINSISSKVVLILGRFTPARKIILDAMKNELRKHNYLPVLFDFEKPTNRDITETVSTLAHIARFVIADITDAKSIPQELQIIIPHLPSVPVQTIIQIPDREYGMFEHFPRYPWVLPIYRYRDVNELLKNLRDCIISPAEQKAQELNK